MSHKNHLLMSVCLLTFQISQFSLGQITKVKSDDDKLETNNQLLKNR